MTDQTITIRLPEPLYRSAAQLARATRRPSADILQESLARTLPPLDDVPPDEVDDLAQLSSLDDAALWRVASDMLPEADQAELEHLLQQHGAAELDAAGETRLAELQADYGRSLVRKAHAWLLLARRGYHVPRQSA